MWSFAFIGMPGPLELIIIVAVLAAIVAAVVIAVRAGSGGARPMDNPNLYPCPDCGRMVSRQAPTCPQCGRPLSPP